MYVFLLKVRLVRLGSWGWNHHWSEDLICETDLQCSPYIVVSIGISWIHLSTSREGVQQPIVCVCVIRACAPKRVRPGPRENKGCAWALLRLQRMRPAENHGRRASHRSDCRSYMSDRREWEEGCETRGPRHSHPVKQRDGDPIRGGRGGLTLSFPTWALRALSADATCLSSHPSQ